MNDGKINLGEALAEIERQLIPKADKNFKNKYQDRLYDYLFKDSIVKIPKGCHAVSLGPSQKIVSVLRDVVRIYLKMWTAIIKNEMIEKNELQKQQGNDIEYELEKIKKITPQILFKWNIFGAFLRGELNSYPIDLPFDYKVVIDKTPGKYNNGKIIFESNLESKVELQSLQNSLIDFIPSKKKGKLSEVKFDRERALLFKMLHKTDSLTTRYYNLSFTNIYERGLYLLENINTMFFMKEFKSYKSKEKTKDFHDYLESLEKENHEMTKAEIYDRYGEEILNKAGKLWDEFLSEQRDKAIKNYLSYNKSGKITVANQIEAENYWEGKIADIPRENYFNYKNHEKEGKEKTDGKKIKIKNKKNDDKKIEAIPNKFIGTNNREYAAMEYELKYPGSSEDEFNKYYDCYHLFIKKLRTLDNPWQVGIKRDYEKITAKREELSRFKNAKDENIYFNGSKIKNDSLGLKFLNRNLGTIKKRIQRPGKK